LASPPCGYRRAGIRYAFYAKRQVIEVEEVLAEVSQRHPELQVGTILKTINGKSCQEVAAMPPCERHSFLRLLGCGGLEVVTSVGNVYSLPAIY
jgi:hypothetical protein